MCSSTLQASAPPSLGAMQVYECWRAVCCRRRCNHRRPGLAYLIERRATADAFRSLARFTVALLESEDEFPHPGRAALPERRDRLDESIHYGLGGPVGPLRHALRAAETMRASLVGFARAFRAVEDRAWAEALARSLVRAFADVGKCVEHGEYQIDVLPTLREPANPGKPSGRCCTGRGCCAGRSKTWRRLPPSKKQGKKRTRAKRPGLRQQVTDFFAWLIDSRSVRRLAVGHGLRYASRWESRRRSIGWGGSSTATGSR